jgi:hypothetical protein
VDCLEGGRPQPFDIADAVRDIAILEQGAANPGRTVELDLSGIE